MIDVTFTEIYIVIEKWWSRIIQISPDRKGHTQKSTGNEIRARLLRIIEFTVCECNHPGNIVVVIDSSRCTFQTRNIRCSVKSGRQVKKVQKPTTWRTSTSLTEIYGDFCYVIAINVDYKVLFTLQLIDEACWTNK